MATYRPRIEKVGKVANLHGQVHLHLDGRRVDDALLSEFLVVSQDRRHLDQQVFDKHSHCVDRLTTERGEVIQGWLWAERVSLPACFLRHK
jgi:hypothetical protein